MVLMVFLFVCRFRFIARPIKDAAENAGPLRAGSGSVATIKALDSGFHIVLDLLGGQTSIDELGVSVSEDLCGACAVRCPEATIRVRMEGSQSYNRVS